ncbi:hypothetical protein Purlil1_3362 [Purpureocillium lilacinum]|uniref:Peptidase M20 dimerisation domain-containing protein n=1 Tax=Purpureocillium lilacinum TaxID=33203 RepID=A0ABR0C7H5_PURLI|nr:hypothetical protein Purlil1_3362 [Purpureocillium lilacinum]
MLPSFPQTPVVFNLLRPISKRPWVWKMASPVENDLLAFLERDRSRLIAMTQELVRQPSPNPPGDVSKVASSALSLIREAIPSSQVLEYKTAPGIINIVATISGQASGRARRLAFSGHMDTYPAGDESQWTHSPFSGALSADGKRIYGRGSTDMKGGIAASILAARVLAEHRDRWSGEVVIALAGDEETMGSLGTGYLLDQVMPVRACDAMLCGDAGSPAILRTGEKGLVWIELTAIGVAAHGAHVHRGVNAIERLLDAISAVKGRLDNVDVATPAEIDEAISAAKPVSEPLGGSGEEKTLRRVTLNVGKISGGVSANLVPDRATAAVDIRLPMGITAAEVIDHVHGALSGLDGVSVHVVRQYDPTWTPQTEEIVRHSVAAARQVVSSKAVVNMRVGASDARLFRLKGIPSVVVGLTPHNMGGPDEYVDVDELLQVAQIHLLTAWRYLHD